MSSDLSTGKTIFILAVVVGCFAVLWPKVFYPMLTASVKQAGSSQVGKWRDQANNRVLSQLCFLIEEQQDPSGFSRLSDEACIEFVRKYCGVAVTEKVSEDFRLSKDKTNLTFCLQQRFDITLEKVLSAAPPPTRTKPYQPQSLPHPHVRPERPSNLHPDSMHPALREKGRTTGSHRTIEKQARPGPMPGVRPPMGGGAHMVPPQTKGSGAMGIIMPLYTVGIVIFFVYTIMKVLFKKSDDEDNKIPKLKDFHLDPEYRKYVFAEEYLDSANASHRDLLKRQERENSKQRRRQDSASQPDTKIEDEQMDQLRRRLEETEKAMERLMSQMGSVTDKLTAAKITEVLSQAQSQARILKDAAEGGSDEDLTTSEAFTNTLSEDFSLPLALQRHLEELKVKDMYLKGTSAGNFGSPPISPDELVSPNGRHNSIEGSAPLIATNTTLLSSFTNGDGAICIEKISHQDGVDGAKDIENEETKECKLDEENNKQIPVVDFPLQVSSSLKQNLKNDQKQKEDLVLSSDIAQYDAAEGHSDREGSSDASETGADISDLKSFADNGAVEVAGSIPIPVVEEQVIPELTYSPRFTETIEMEKENVAVQPVITSSDEKLFNLHLKSSAVEHGTQTDENQKLSVLNLRTTYQIDKIEQNKGMNIKDVEDRVNEIVLDATLPVDTQLLVREAQTGSAVTNNIEIDASEMGSEPCVVTSQVSLAFVGLEHNDTEAPYTLVFPEMRTKDFSDIKNLVQQPIQDTVLKINDFAEVRNNNKNQELSQKEEVKTDKNIIEKDSEKALTNEEINLKGIFSNIVEHPTKGNDLKQENYTDNEIIDSTALLLKAKENSDDCFDKRNIYELSNKEASTKGLIISESSDMAKKLAKDSQNDSSDVRSIDLTFQPIQSKETNKDDNSAEPENSNILLQSVPFKEIEPDPIDKNICIFQEPKEKDGKTYSSKQSHTVDNVLHHKILGELDTIVNQEALAIRSEELAQKELISNIIHDNTENVDNQTCAGIIEIPKTVSLESFDLTPELLHGLEEPTNEEEFIAIEFLRPESPVPPAIYDSQFDNKNTFSKYNETKHSNSDTFKDVNIACVEKLANKLVENSTNNALHHISSLPPDNNFLNSSIETSQIKCTSIVGGNQRQEYHSPLERYSNINEQVQPGEVVGSKESESGGENENMFVATIRCISKVSPPGSPFTSDINTSFSLENANLTDHCTQPVTPTPFVEDPALKDEEGCSTELRSPSPNSSALNKETIREQESAYKRSSFDTHETDMNHKVEDDFSVFEEASDKELNKPNMQEKESEENKKKRNEERDSFTSQKDEEIKFSDANEQVIIQKSLKENGTLKHQNETKEKIEKEKENEYGSTRNIKEADENLCYLKFDLNESKNIRLRNLETKEDEISENENFEELQKKFNLKKIDKKVFVSAEVLGVTKTLEEITQSKIHCDRLENASDFTPENDLLSKNSLAEGNQEFSVSMAAQGTDQGK